MWDVLQWGRFKNAARFLFLLPQLTATVSILMVQLCIAADALNWIHGELFSDGYQQIQDPYSALSNAIEGLLLWHGAVPVIATLPRSRDRTWAVTLLIRKCPAVGRQDKTNSYGTKRGDTWPGNGRGLRTIIDSNFSATPNFDRSLDAGIEFTPFSPEDVVLLFLTGQPEKIITNTQKKISTTVWLTVFFIRKEKPDRKGMEATVTEYCFPLMLSQVCVIYPSQVFEPHILFKNSTSAWDWGPFSPHMC